MGPEVTRIRTHHRGSRCPRTVSGWPGQSLPPGVFSQLSYAGPAGCVVTDLRGGQLEGGGGLIAAANAEAHQRLVALVAPHLEVIIDED